MLDAKILLRIAAEDKKLVEEAAYEMGYSINKYILWKLELHLLRDPKPEESARASGSPNDGGFDGD